MPEHYRTLSAVFPIIIGNENGKMKVLLARRMNTGYIDGMWDFAGSGHVDRGETASQAVIRECMEELGITCEPCDIRFAHLSHRLGKNNYYDIYFTVERFSGKPYIAEPEKCSELLWFYLDALPHDMIEIRKKALENHLNGEHYSEIVVE